MIKLFRFLTGMFFIITLSDALAATTAASSAVQDAIQDKNALKIIVKDFNQNPVSGINITTQNLNKNMSATTDRDGIARFENMCEMFAKIGREFSNARRKNPKTNKLPVLIKATDPDGKYKNYNGYLEWDDYSGKTGCERTITFGRGDIRETFPTPEQLKLAFDNRNGNLKFYDICTSGKQPGGKIQSGCIDVFKDTNVQLNEGIYLAKSYMLQKIIPDNTNVWIECVGTPIRTKHNQDYLKCTSTDGKYAYDFEFDDLIESVDNDVLTDTARALCEHVYDGIFDKSGNNRICAKNSAYETEQMCNEIRGATYDLSWTTEFRKSLNVNYSYIAPVSVTGFTQNSSTQTTKQNVCLFNFRGVNESYKPKNTINGKIIDITKYEYIEVRSLPSLEFLIHQYIQAQLDSKLDDFRCASGFRIWNSENGTKHLLDCKATINAQQYTLEFVFDNVNVRTELVSNAGEGGMNCIGTGGSFDGENCMGLTHEQCKELDSKAPGGATWDKDIKQCVLNDASKLQTLQSIGDALLTGITIAGTVVVVVATAGTAAPVIAGLAVTGGALSLSGTALELYSESTMRNKTEEFKQLYNNCKNQPVAEQDPCARSVLRSFLGYIDTYLKEGAFDGQYAKSLDDIFQNLVNLTEPDRITEQDVINYSSQQSDAKNQVLIKNIGIYSATIGDFALIFAGGTNAVKTLSKRGISIAANGVAIVNTANKANKMSRFFARVYNLTRKSGSVANDTHTISSNIQKISDIPAHTHVGACWQSGKLVPCTG